MNKTKILGTYVDENQFVQEIAQRKRAKDLIKIRRFDEFFNGGYGKVYPDLMKKAALLLYNSDDQDLIFVYGLDKKFPRLAQDVVSEWEKQGSSKAKIFKTASDSVGVFAKLPKSLAKKFPSLGNHDNSDPHITVLFIGQVPEDKHETLKGVVSDVCKGWKPFKVELDDKVTYFPASKHSDGCKIAKVAIKSKDLHKLNKALKKAIREAGIEVDDHFLSYKPHVTLSYLSPGQEKYEDEVPTGDWEIKEVEVWSAGPNHTAKLGQKLSKRANYENTSNTSKNEYDPVYLAKNNPTLYFKKDLHKIPGYEQETIQAARLLFNKNPGHLANIIGSDKQLLEILFAEGINIPAYLARNNPTLYFKNGFHKFPDYKQETIDAAELLRREDIGYFYNIAANDEHLAVILIENSIASAINTNRFLSQDELAYLDNSLPMRLYLAKYGPEVFFLNGLQKKYPELAIEAAKNFAIKDPYSFFRNHELHLQDQYRDLGVETARKLAIGSPAIFFGFKLQNTYPEFAAEAAKNLAIRDPHQFFATRRLHLQDQYREFGVDAAKRLATKHPSNFFELDLQNTYPEFAAEAAKDLAIKNPHWFFYYGLNLQDQYSEATKEAARKFATEEPYSFFELDLQSMYPEIAIEAAKNLVTKYPYSFFRDHELHLQDQYRDLGVEAARELATEDPGNFFELDLQSTYPEIAEQAKTSLLSTQIKYDKENPDTDSRPQYAKEMAQRMYNEGHKTYLHTGRFNELENIGDIVGEICVSSFDKTNKLFSHQTITLAAIFEGKASHYFDEDVYSKTNELGLREFGFTHDGEEHHDEGWFNPSMPGNKLVGFAVVGRAQDKQTHDKYKSQAKKLAEMNGVSYIELGGNVWDIEKIRDKPLMQEVEPDYLPISKKHNIPEMQEYASMKLSKRANQSPFPKSCSCGQTYNAEEYMALPLKREEDPDDPERGVTCVDEMGGKFKGKDAVYRNCPCGSTMTVLLPCQHKDHLKGGLGDKKDFSEFDPEQLAKGIRVEMEHTDDPEIAREIAGDHLSENPKYYDELEKIERHSFSDYPISKKARCITELEARWYASDYADDQKNKYESEKNDPKWNKILIDADKKWTRKQIRDHYIDNAEKILKEIKGQPVMIYIGTGENEKILKRKHNNKPIIFNSKNDIRYWADRRLLSIHRVFQKNTDLGLIDLDIHDGISQSLINNYTKDISAKIKSMYNTTPVVYSSGSKQGRHIEFRLKNKIDIDKLRKDLRAVADELNENYENFTTGIVKGKGVRVDTTILSNNGNIRVPWAIHETSGGVKKPIHTKEAFVDFPISKRAGMIDYPKHMYDEMVDWLKENLPRLKRKFIIFKGERDVEHTFKTDISDTKQWTEHEWLRTFFPAIQEADWFTDITLRITNQGIPGSAQYYEKAGKQAIIIYNPTGTSFSEVTSALKHELIHMMQAIFDWSLFLKGRMEGKDLDRNNNNRAGIPRRYDKNTYKKYDGLPASNENRSEYITKHDTSDVEFFPSLSDVYNYIKEEMLGVSEESTKRSVFEKVIKTHPFLRVLKESEPENYQKAIRELYRKVFAALDYPISKHSGLAKYKQKRDFTETREPEGKVVKKNKHRFVIQEHKATNKHWDLRLENDQGTLSSWAIPKAKLPDNDKLLAKKTEDHPVEYLKFKGEIKKGYGAGEVKIVASGKYNLGEWGTDKVVFSITSGKAKGDWALIHTDKDNWLWLRKNNK